MKTPIRLSFLFAILLQVACGGDELSVRGDVTANANGADHVFSFPETTNLATSGGGDVFAGYCNFDGESLNAGITRPGSGQEGLTDFFLFVTPEATGVQVSVDGAVYMNGECEIDVLYSDECDGVFAAEVDCSGLFGPDGTAGVSGELHFAGCDSF
ncbi:MAG: hypothetical protein AB8H86_07630 [Polyangiales bacterium]